MRRTLAILLLALAGPVTAQDGATTADSDPVAEQGPTLDVDFGETEAIPGQPLSLRLTVLVPTFMPDPPVWPGLEAPNLLVRLPEGSTGPTSQRVGGETWSGITRHYRISPMVPGEFVIPPQDVLVTYADPETNEPVKVTLTTGSIAFTGVVPEGAEALDPFIAANSLELSQDIEGDPSAMSPGDSVTRRVTARIGGTSPMFLPDIMPATVVEGVAAYPDEPVIEESDDRGVVSGTRVESVTFVAEGGGEGEAPAVSLDWYHIETGEVETATVAGFQISVEGPPATRAEPPDWRAITAAAVAGLVLLGLVLWLLRRALPPLRRWFRHRRGMYLGSERYAYEQLQHALNRRDHAHLHSALDDWARRVDGPDPRDSPEVARALTELGAARYGRVPGDDATVWRDLRKALADTRHRAAPPRAAHEALPPLNPGS